MTYVKFRPNEKILKFPLASVTYQPVFMPVSARVLSCGWENMGNNPTLYLYAIGDDCENYENRLFDIVGSGFLLPGGNPDVNRRFIGTATYDGTITYHVFERL